MIVDVLPVAEREAVATALSFASGSTGLEFLDAYDEALARITADPSSLPKFLEASSEQVRFKFVGRFPYLVLFSTADPARAVVFSVIHAAAGPGRIAKAERRL